MSNEWIEHFSILSDPRTGNRKEHNLTDIVIIALTATICGADGWAEIERFGKLRQEWSFGRVFSLLAPQAFEQAFCSWTQSLHQTSQEGRL